MKYQIHPSSLCDSKSVGDGTRIWAFCNVLGGATIGRDCNICDHTFIENDVAVGDRVTIKSGVQLWDGVTVEDDVFIGPNVTFSNDKLPRSKVYPAKFARTLIERGASLGANATILPGIRVGQNAMVGAGAVVTRSVPPNAIVTGNPARVVNYVSSSQAAASPAGAGPTVSENAGVSKTDVDGVTVHELHTVEDARGNLAVAEVAELIPMSIARCFFVYQVPSKDIRGDAVVCSEHAHRRCMQFLLCVAGSCSVVADDGRSRTEIVLDRPSVGIFVPPMIWCTQYKYSSDAVLMVLASESYDPDDYIRDYNEFLARVRRS